MSHTPAAAPRRRVVEVTPRKPAASRADPWREPADVAEAEARRGVCVDRLSELQARIAPLTATIKSQDMRDHDGRRMTAHAALDLKARAGDERAALIAEQSALQIEAGRLRRWIGAHVQAERDGRFDAVGMVRRLVEVIDRLADEGARLSDADRELLDIAGELFGDGG